MNNYTEYITNINNCELDINSYIIRVIGDHYLSSSKKINQEKYDNVYNKLISNQDITKELFSAIDKIKSHQSMVKGGRQDKSAKSVTHDQIYQI